MRRPDKTIAIRVNAVRSSYGALNPVFANLFNIHPYGKTAGHFASNGVKQFSSRSSEAALALKGEPRVLALPRLRLFGLAGFPLFSLSPMWRKGISAASIAVGLAAIAVYIAAVNVMLLDGQALNREAKILAKLEQDYIELQGLLVQRQSPGRLQAYAFQNGMVAAGGVRYINSSQPVALSR